MTTKWAGLRLSGGATAVWLAMWLLSGGSSAGQTLARRNWEGSGLTVQTWWSRGVFCAAGSDVRRAAGEMVELEKVGCDAVEVDLDAEPVTGAVTEMDALVEAAGRAKMRVVVDLDGSVGEQAVKARVGFWAARGVAGFGVRGMAVGRLRQATPGRLWIGDGGQLAVRQIPEGDAANVQAWLAGLGTGRQGILLEDGTARLGYARAAMLLTSGGAARVRVDAVLSGGNGPELTREFSAEELLLWIPKEKTAKNGMAEWVRALSELHHQNATLRTGTAVFVNLNAPGVMGWIVAARDGRSAVVVICNLGEKPVRVGLTSPVRGAGVRGMYLKTLLRSDGGVGSGDTLDAVGLDADGVFVGEVR